jgi:GDPmannose 4,6-dehydratase
MARTALITGITGQDGSYLAEFLLEQGYQVHGLVRRSSSESTGRIAHLLAAKRIELHHGDLSDAGGLRELIDRVEPDELYNLAAQSHVKVSFDQPEYTVDVTGLGVVRLLEALRARLRAGCKPTRFYQAGSSEMYGSAPSPQDEATPFHPRSPYACAKVYAHHQVVNHRESHGLFASNGILFNHESPRRGEAFVTRKITRAAARIKLGLQAELQLGNLDVARDWGYAGDYVRAMWAMLQQDSPGDWCICTGRSATLREFLELAFGRLQLEWREHVVVDPTLFRPADVHHLRGDASKARRELGWSPATGLEALVALMVDSDLELAQREAALRQPIGR